MGVEFEMENGVTRSNFGGFKENENYRFVWRTIQDCTPSKFNLIPERENTTKMKFALEGGDQKNRLNIVSLNAHFRFQSMVKINGLARDVNSIRNEEKSSFL